MYTGNLNDLISSDHRAISAMMNAPFVASALATILILSALPAGAATVYSSRSDWEAAVTGVTTDPFANAIAAGASIVLDSGITSNQVGNTIRPNSNRVVLPASQFDAEIGNAFGIVTSIQWVFPEPVMAFGANFNVFPDSTGISGNFDGTGNQVFTLPSDVITTNFFGIVGETAFSSVTFSAIDGDLGIGIQIDDAAFAAQAASPVPIPAAVWLLGSGLLGLYRSNRSGRAAKAAMRA
ncbi:MAG: hypothetical protein WD928_00760 [Gammaproteobacteria bacterium]